MSGSCCSSPGNNDQFDERTARFRARWHRWFGLSRSARTILAALAARGIDGARVLEIGGGLGHLQLALLTRGAAHATNLDLSPNWEEEARALAAEQGVADRITRIVGDAAEPPPLQPADVVVLHRVVCCTDAWAEMLDTALSVGPRLVALTLPRSVWWTHAFARVGNALERRRGRDFRVRIHDPAAVLGHLRASDMTVVHDTGGPVWRTVVLEAALAPATTT